MFIYHKTSIFYIIQKNIKGKIYEEKHNNGRRQGPGGNNREGLHISCREQHKHPGHQSDNRRRILQHDDDRRYK